MKLCRKCGAKIPCRITIDSKQYMLHTRVYCLTCSPFGTRKFCGPIPKFREKGSSSRFGPRVCSSCNKQFNQRTKNSVCSTCRAKKYRSENKQKAIAYLGGKCQICGYTTCKEALQFHHKNPAEKQFTLTGNWEKSWDKLVKEIDKCALLCSRCHTELHMGLANLGGVDQWQSQET